MQMQVVAVSFIAALAQLFCTLFIFGDMVDFIVNDTDDNITFCNNTAFWLDRLTAAILALYVLCFYVQKSMSLFRDVLVHVKGMWWSRKFSFVSQDIFVAGRAINLNSLNLTSLGTILVLYTQEGVLQLILAVFALHFLHEFPKKLVDSRSHKICKNFLNQFYESHISVQQHLDETSDDDIELKEIRVSGDEEDNGKGGESSTVRKGKGKSGSKHAPLPRTHSHLFEKKDGEKQERRTFCIFFFLIFGVPVIVSSILTMAAVSMSVIWLPVCKI